MPHLLIGTAGHVDHGKTRLIEALTGIDCDRWQEEKERGITIDLGFAHLEEGDLQIGFVDVPGHARFLHNALAGLGGIRLMLLVVAADEGVKPQTRDHVDICRLLEIPHAVVAVTKADLVQPDLLELACDEVRDFLADGPYADAPVQVVSSLSGDGIEALRDLLIDRARSLGIEGDDGVPPRLPIDRAFQLQGRGTIVTGTLLSGSLATGTELEWGPGGGLTRIRSMQVHGSARERATSGERVALQLAGVSVDELSRGVQLFTPGALAPTTHLAARISLLPQVPTAIKGWTDVVVHVLTAEVGGRMRPLHGTLRAGDEGLIEIRTHRPILATRGDRLILRRPSPAITFGGGRILDPFWRRRRGSRLQEALEALENDADAIVFWVSDAGPAGRSAADLAHRHGWEESAAVEQLEALTAAGRLVELGEGDRRRWITPATDDAVRRRAASVLAAYFRGHRLAAGLSKAEAAERILGTRARQLADVYFARLARDGVLIDAGDSVDLPGRQNPLSGEESELATTIRRRFEEGALAPPSPADLRRDLGAKPQIVDGLIGYLLERGRLVRLPGGLILAATALQDLRRDLLDSDLTTLSVADFKKRYQLSRKWAIPLLEHLDSTGTTRRMGDLREIVRGR